MKSPSKGFMSPPPLYPCFEKGVLLRLSFVPIDPGDAEAKTLQAFQNALEAYFQAQPETLMAYPFHWPSEIRPFRKKVLEATLRIPAGQTTTYADLAERIGHPQASRAVGTALAKNPFPLRIPCHRVLRKGALCGQYLGGTDLKRALLEQEGAVLSASSPLVRPLSFR